MFGHRGSSKGITPIIATILLVMMAVAAASAMFFWITKIQGQGQGAVEQSQTILLERIAACATIPTFSFNTFDNTSDMAVQNCGNTNLEIGDGDDNALVASDSCSFILDCDVITGTCPITLGPGGITAVKLDMEQADCSGAPGTTVADILSSEEGIQHQFILTLSTGGRAVTTAARSFVPRSSPPPAPLVCSVDIILSPPPASPNAGPRPICFKYGLNNTGATTENFNISITSITGGPCSAALFSGSLTCGGAPVTSFLTGSVSPGGTAIFSLEHIPPIDVAPCIVVVQANSTGNATCSDTDTTTTLT